LQRNSLLLWYGCGKITLSQEEEQLFDLALIMQIPVSRLVKEMSYEELLGWQNYFDHKPYGYREDIRAYRIMMAFGNKLPKAEDLFESIAAVKKRADERSAGQKLAGSKMLAMIMTARGGDAIPL